MLVEKSDFCVHVHNIYEAFIMILLTLAINHLTAALFIMMTFSMQDNFLCVCECVRECLLLNQGDSLSGFV